MVHSATPCVDRASMESALSAGKTAPRISVRMVHSAQSPLLTDVASDTPFGMRTGATGTTLNSDARNGEPSGTLDAEQTSTM